MLDGQAVQLVAQAAEDRQLAQALSKKWNFSLSKRPPTVGFFLVLNQHTLTLHSASQTQQRVKEGGVAVDFASDVLTYRRQHGGGKQEFIARAVGIKAASLPHVLDATAGLGRDGFILASLGCQVTLMERSPIVGALLENGLQRAALDPELASWIEKRLRFVSGDSVTLMQAWAEEGLTLASATLARPDVVYLDPMFPQRKKSALVKKELRLLHELLGPDPAPERLLMPALQLATQRVVVKRPQSAPPLTAQQPDLCIKSKKHRFDVYLIRGV